MTLPCHAVEVVAGTPRPTFPPRFAYGPESILTQCAIRLWTIRGVWPDDVNLGLPWLSLSLASVPNEAIEALLRRQLLAVEGVRQVLAVDVTRPGTEVAVVARVLLDAGGGLVDAAVGDLGVYDGVISGTWYQILGDGIRPIAPLDVP